MVHAVLIFSDGFVLFFFYKCLEDDFLQHITNNQIYLIINRLLLLGLILPNCSIFPGLPGVRDFGTPKISEFPKFQDPKSHPSLHVCSVVLVKRRYPNSFLKYFKNLPM